MDICTYIYILKKVCMYVCLGRWVNLVVIFKSIAKWRSLQHSAKVVLIRNHGVLAILCIFRSKGFFEHILAAFGLKHVTGPVGACCWRKILYEFVRCHEPLGTSILAHTHNILTFIC
jgi:hypothetical protein